MKKTLRIMVLALLAFGIFACGEKKITEDDLKKVESTLSDESGKLNEEAVPTAVEKFCKFVDQNPDNPSAPDWLFKAMQFEIKVGASDKAIELCDKLLNDYPDYRNNPAALVMLANEVYDSQLHDLDKARATYEKVISDYPDSNWVESAEKLIEYLGLTPEEIMTRIMISGMEEVEGEW